jgi:hypothetical protein
LEPLFVLSRGLLYLLMVILLLIAT